MSSIDSNDYTLGQVFESLEESGAGLMTVVFRDEDDEPIRGFIAFDGAETGRPLLGAAAMADSTDWADEVWAAWMQIYEHAVPDPDSAGDEDGDIPLETREQFEKALQTVHEHMKLAADKT